MSQSRTSSGKKQLIAGIDMPFAIAAAVMAGFYWLVNQPPLNHTLLHRYTTEHYVEYVIVGFFIWGITDIVFRALTFPRENAALKHDWFPARHGREPIAATARLLAIIADKPEWLRNSRIGQRLTQALLYLQEKGSADELALYLRQLGDQDDDRTHANFGLIRFIAWVTPVLGFLGTVVHFGTALGGLSVDQIADRLPAVVSEMGTAFNTTCVALIAAISMMFALFLGERSERAILHQVDRRTEDELLNRFEITDASLTPFLSALEVAGRATLQTMESAVARQLELWSTAFNDVHGHTEETHRRQAEVWAVTMKTLQERYEAAEQDREQRFRKILEAVDVRQEEVRQSTHATVAQAAALRDEFHKLVDSLNTLAKGEGKLVETQRSLSENLRLLKETSQIDEALHGLTAAIHLLTARHGGPRENRAA